MTPDIENALEFSLKNNYNVLLVGKAGVGKTEMIKDIFNKNNVKWKYFSAATMEPWVDFIGVPREHTDENGVSYLTLIKPEEFAKDEVEAIFFDELNRAPAKVRNAVMELIQFKSINGKKFNNLRMIWAAINPYTEDEEYNVEKLDPAQEDRFHVKIDIPYQLSAKYFIGKYGVENYKKILGWWDGLNENKQMVSPRRLDYAVQVILSGGNVDWVIPKKLNPKYLNTLLNSVNLLDWIKSSTYETNIKQFSAAMKNYDNFQSIINILLEGIEEEYEKRIIEHLPYELVFKYLLDCDKKHFNIITKIMLKYLENGTVQNTLKMLGNTEISKKITSYNLMHKNQIQPDKNIIYYDVDSIEKLCSDMIDHDQHASMGLYQALFNNSVSSVLNKESIYKIAQTILTIINKNSNLTINTTFPFIPNICQLLPLTDDEWSEIFKHDSSYSKFMIQGFFDSAAESIGRRITIRN